MRARIHRYAFAAVLSLTILAIGHTAHAQNLRVMPVPWVATDSTIPHQAYNGHATTLKAIARGGNGSYSVEWDPEGDGTYMAPFVTANRYNLSQRFTYPNQAVTTTFQAKVKVTSNAQTVIGTYPVRIFADVPANPATATVRQLQVMRGVAVDDGLWYLHNQLTRTGNEEDALTGAQITGTVSGSTTAATSGFLWNLGLNGHYVAYNSAYIGALPNPTENTLRFTTDPYAEDAARCLNYLVNLLVNSTTDAASEANNTGFYPEIQKAPIYGTDDLHGLTFGEDIYRVGHAMAALAVSNLGGYVAQVGDSTYVLGRRLEFVLQQMVDALAYGQNEGGVANDGSWYYTANGSNDLSTTLWGMTGLWHAEEFASSMGIIVPNSTKARLVAWINQDSNVVTGGRCGTYTEAAAAPNCDFGISAGHVLALGWIGANTFDAADTRLAFPSYNSLTRGTLRTLFDQTTAWLGTNFAGITTNCNMCWNNMFAEGGNFNRVDRHASHYSMLHWQDAARATVPAIVTFGGNDWEHLFSTYMVNNQETDGRWQSVGVTGNTSDQQGGVTLHTTWALLVLSPDAIPPLAIAQVTPTTAPEGTTISFNGDASDPGTGNPIYTWAFGNGATMPGQTVTYAYPDNGAFNATLTSTSIGGTSVDTVAMTITNVAPTASAGPDLAVDEGTSQGFTVSVTDPGTADTFSYSWNFGDGSPAATTQSPSHSYADNGTYNVVVTVTDDDGGVGTDTVVVTVNNVDPVITSTPGTTATEGSPYTYTMTYTDAGSADTGTCSAPTMPTGMTLDVPTCTVDWTPNFAQALGASAPVSICVTDDDGGTTCQDYEIDITFVDVDVDGLPDSWEVANFGDITSQGANGDPDGDGRDNLQEFTEVTDPNVYDGPTAPTPLTPTCGGEIASFQTSLVATNATQGTALEYEFELYGDVGLGVLIDSESGIPEGVGTTTWPVGVNLLENTRYYWRVRARDNNNFYGPFSTVCDFFVNTVNEAPGVPHINTPSFGSQVNSLTPTLVVDNATDPDEDILTYEYEVYLDPALSTLVANQVGVASGVTTTSWLVDVTLTEDTTYYWRVRATDPDDLSGDWSSTGQFFVTTVNAPPEPPIIVAPQNGTVVDDLRPELVILNADDSDFDLLVYDWEISEDATFTTLVDSGTDVPAQGQSNTTFQLAADLDEDTHYCWRARADDGASTSAYSTACFLVSESNDPPSVPTLQNPSDTSVVPSVSPTFSWATSTDPEDQPITYDVEVMDPDGSVIDSVTGVSGTVTAMGLDLEQGITYTWHARAVDADGAMSEYSDPNEFQVDTGLPDIVVDGGGCSTGKDGGPAGVILLGLGVLGLARRRRK